MERIKGIFQNAINRAKRIIGNRNFKRYSPLIIVALLAAITFATCVPRSAPEPEPPVILEPPPSLEPSADPEPTPDPDPDPDPVLEPDLPYDGPVNPLTGLPTETDLTNTRPLAFVINNIRVALPQLGISQADIIYETLVEGGITRMLALYQDVSEVGVIGSIRSSRLYFVDIVQSYDAIFMFGGGSPQAYSALRSRDITRCDGVAGPRPEVYYRDQHRRSSMGSEHSLVTSGSRIMQHFPTYDIRFEHPDGYERALSFADDGAPAGGSPALDFSVSFSSSKTTSFKYNEDDKLYYLRQYDRDYIDGNDNTQLAFTNVLILRATVSRVRGDTEGRLDIVTKGSESGYFVCGGKYVEINWARADDESQFSYTQADGSELVFGRGKTYICIVPKDSNVIIS